MIAAAEVEKLTDELYGAPLERFVDERARLVSELRKGGNRVDAAALAKAGKPTVSAWVVNQLARRERAAIQTLGEASAGVREAQLAMVSGQGGSRDAFTAAAATQRRTLSELRKASERILAEGGHAATPAVLERITRNLRAMVTSPEVGRQIEAGRLVQDLPADAFADLAALVSAAPANLPVGDAPARHAPAPRPGVAPAAAPKRRAPVAPAPDARGGEARARAGGEADARTRAKEEADARARARAEAEARAAAAIEARRRAQEQAQREREVARLRRAAEAADARLGRLREVAARARREADEAESAAREGEAAATAAHSELSAAEAALGERR